MSNQHDFDNKEERDKRILMWSGIIFFMVLFVFIWLVNTSKFFARISEERTAEKSEILNWKDSVNDSVDELKLNFEQFNKIIEENISSDEVENNNISSSEEEDIDDQNFIEEEQNILDLENDQTQNQE